MQWTDDAIEHLRKRWVEDGASAAEIGRELYCSRSAVIGKVNRMGFVQPLDRRQDKYKRAVERRNEKRRFTTDGRGKYKRVSLFKLFKRDLARKLAAEESATAVKFDELNSLHCRYPVSGEGRNMLFCGAPQFQRSYCFRHFHACYVPPDRKMSEKERMIRAALARKNYREVLAA